MNVSGISTSVSQDSFQLETQSETAETESFPYSTEYIDNGDVSNYVNEYHCFGEEVGKIAYDTEKTESISSMPRIYCS